jgi:hypothetical protein
MAEWNVEEFRKGLEIDQTKLDEELATQASRYLFVAEKAVTADMQHDLFKAQLSELEASMDATVRAEAAKAGDKKPTEAAIRAEIERRPDYQKAVRHLIELRARKEVMKSLRESWYMRKDMLIQLAIKQRSELESTLAGTVKMA